MREHRFSGLVRPNALWLVLVLGLLTAWILLDSRVSFSYRGPEARLITETGIAFIGLGVVVLSLNRFFESGLVLDAAIAVAFAMLTLPNVGQGLVLPSLGVDLLEWQDAGIYVWSASRTVAFLVLLVPLVYLKGRAVPADRRLGLVVAGGSVVLAVGTMVYVLSYLFHSNAPDLLTASGRAMIAAGASVRGAFVEVTAAQAALQLGLTAFIALSCLVFLSRSASSVPGDRFHRWVGISLIFAAFSQLHYAAYPSIYSPAISTGDILRLAFYAALLTAIYAEYLRYQRSLQQLSALEERARIARDIHDGAAQGLAFVVASMTQAVHDGLASAVGGRLRRWREILVEAQDNLRDAVIVLRPTSSGGELAATVSQFCRDFSRLYEMGIDFQCVGRPSGLRPPKDRELLFILAGALHNVRKHSQTAQATVVLEARPRCLVLRVSDNGVGLSPFQSGNGPAGPSTRYGYTAMTDRATQLGGSLSVTSEAQKGTTVQLTMPR